MTTSAPPKGQTFLEGIKAYFSQGFYFGAADIFCCGRFETVAIVSDLIFLLSMIYDEDGKHAIRKFVIVIPPSVDGSTITEESIRAGFADTVARARGRPLDDNEKATAARLLNVVEAPDLQIRSAIEIIERVPKRSAVIVCHAARYRDEFVALPPAGEKARLDEDTWSVYLQNFAERAVSLARDVECYIAFDAGEPAPRRQENVDLLGSVPDCGVLCAAFGTDPAELIAQHGDEWLETPRPVDLAQLSRPSMRYPPRWTRTRARSRRKCFTRPVFRRLRSISFAKKWQPIRIWKVSCRSNSQSSRNRPAKLIWL